MKYFINMFLLVFTLVCFSREVPQICINKYHVSTITFKKSKKDSKLKILVVVGNNEITLNNYYFYDVIKMLGTDR